MLIDIFARIEALWLVRLIVTVPGVYPTLSALHIIGIGLLLGAIVAADLRLVRLLGPQLDRAMPTLVRMALAGSALAATTGLLLASIRIANYAANPAFLVKMAILATAGCNALLLRLVHPSRDLATIVGTYWSRACSRCPCRFGSPWCSSAVGSPSRESCCFRRKRFTWRNCLHLTIALPDARQRAAIIDCLKSRRNDQETRP